MPIVDRRLPYPADVKIVSLEIETAFNEDQTMRVFKKAAPMTLLIS
jgi:hypothetical protein